MNDPSVGATQPEVRQESTGPELPSADTTTTAPLTFGDYEILTEIAHGGMGIVYKARQKSLGRIIALKMIRSGQFASADEVQRFHREAKAAANLEHANIVPIYEDSEHQGQHFFSMKFVEGGSLGKKGPHLN
jgi:serine/threonine protein kinase